MTHEIPSLPGLLSAHDVRATAASIARAQEASGAIPWFAGGHVDTWDHVECAMALLVGGEVEAAERAYAWLFETQRDDGSWPMKITAGVVDDPATDTNMTAYVAVGVWHHWLVRRDEAFVRRAWPVVRRALDCVTAMQLPFGGIAWAANAFGEVGGTALVAGSSSIYHALACGLALSELVDQPQPEWELAAGRLGHAVREHEDLFDPKRRYSMDWYYPILGGALREHGAASRVEARWDDFVVQGLGIRCVDDRPWVTGAETCELVLALDAIGERDRAREQLEAMQHLRDPDGSYWTGYVYADDARWPVECSTWTAAAVVLAVDALAGTTPGSDIFRGSSLRGAFTEIGLECGCVPSDASASANRVAGLSSYPR
ncbi:MAG TPA: prenyltransferase [Nocardioidaceae bacterium]|nr:prenyltransferase [Nocardioidaceae bacterium]